MVDMTAEHMCFAMTELKHQPTKTVTQKQALMTKKMSSDISKEFMETENDAEERLGEVDEEDEELDLLGLDGEEVEWFK